MTCFFFHKWGKWEMLEGYRQRFIDGVKVKYDTIFQKRICERCGKTQVQEIEP